jgi:hypothetical protein
VQCRSRGKCTQLFQFTWYCMKSGANHTEGTVYSYVRLCGQYIELRPVSGSMSRFCDFFFLTYSWNSMRIYFEYLQLELSCGHYFSGSNIFRIITHQSRKFWKYIHSTHNIKFWKYIHSTHNMCEYYIKKNEMGWACGAYGGGERCSQGFGGEA